MPNEINLDTVADFSWDFGSTFFLETAFGLFEWSDPDYGGDNTIRRSKYSSIEDHFNQKHLFLRCKGTHTIRSYCGESVSFVKEERDE